MASLLAVLLGCITVTASGVALWRRAPLRGVGKAQAAPPAMPSGGMAMPQTLVCGLWRTSPDLVAKIHIKNALMVAPLSVMPTLYMADGTPYSLPPVEVPMAGEATVNINQALQNAPSWLGGHVSAYGSAALTYRWDGAGHVSASMNLKDLVHSLTFHQTFLDLPSSMGAMGSMAAFTGYERWQEKRERAVLASYHVPTPGARQEREASRMRTPPLQGLWWKRDPGVAGYFALANTSSAPIEVRYRVAGSTGAQGPGATVGLGPNATAIVPLDPLVATLPPNQRDGGGITLEQLSGRAMAMSASGWMENEREGFSASIEFEPGYMPPPMDASASSSGPAAPTPPAPPPGATGPVVLAATGLMLDKPMSGAGFPDRVRFRPYGYLRNTSRRPLLATVTANLAMGTMGMTGIAGPPPVSQSLEVALMPQALVPVALAPLARSLEREMARKMNVEPDAIEGAMLNWSVSFDGRDGDVLMTTGSTDQTGNYVFEVIPVRMSHAVGLQLPYWNTAHGNDTMYSLWNPGSTPQNVVLTLYSADGMHTYAVPVTLAPGASANVDIGRLRQEGTPDPSGNLLPPEVQDGSAMLEPAAAAQPGPHGKVMQPASGPAQMQVAVNAGIFNAQAATCCSECSLCCFYTCPAVAAELAAIGGTMQSDFTVEDCCGFLDDFTAYAGWGSGDSSILGSQGAGLFEAIAVGETLLSAQASGLQTEQASGYPVCARVCLSGILGSNNNGTVTQCAGDTPGSTVTDAGGATEYGAATDRGPLIAEYSALGVQDDSACSPSDSTCIHNSPLFGPTCTDFTDNTKLGGPYYYLNTLKGSDVYSWALIQYPLVEPSGDNRGLNAWAAKILTMGYSTPGFNSGYRTPTYNSTLAGSAANSRHLFGDAADLESGTCAVWTDFDNAAVNAAAPTFVEAQSDSTCGHVHADWRSYDAGGGSFQH